MVGGRPGAVRPDSGNMPGWREEVEPAKKDSVFWPSGGALAAQLTASSTIS